MQADPSVLYQVFRHSYSPNAQERSQAEAWLRQASGTPGLLGALLQVVRAGEVEVPIRQAAAIQLKNQLRVHWESGGRAASYPEEQKAPIRAQLVDSVASVVAEKGVRSQLVECFRLVALSDFPELWPGVADRLLAGLRSDDTAQTLCSLLLLRKLFKHLEMRPANRRKDLNDLATKILPTLLILGPALATAAARRDAASGGAFEMLKLVLKSFHSATLMSVPAQVQQDVKGWMALLLGVAEVAMEVPRAGFEQVQEESCEAKCRKWVFQILLRFLQKHSHPRLAPEELEQFAQAYSQAYEVPITRRCVHEVCAQHRGSWAPKRSTSLSMLCLAAACRRDGAYEALKPELQELLQFGIFPQIRFGDVEMQLWQLDPEELLRELLSDCDSDSRPHQAAMELVEKLLLYRHKEVLLPLLQFSQLHLEAADQSDLAHANKEGALVLLGLMADHLVDLDPTQLPEGGEGKKQKKKGRNRPSQTVSIEELLARFVLPALASSAAFVRLRALWVSAAFARQAPRLGRRGAAAGLCTEALKLLHDQELPVRVVAASCLEAFLQREQDEVRQAVAAQLPAVLERLLRGLTETQCEEVAQALQSLIEAFPNEVVPFAAQLIVGLAGQFCQLMEHRDDDDDDNDNEMPASGSLATIVTVLHACTSLQHPEDIGEQQRRCALFSNLVDPLLPIVARALHPEGIDFLEEGLEMLTYLTAFCAKPIPPALWGPFPRLYQAVCGKSTASLQLPEVLEGGWAPDFMTSLLEPMLNYIARGPIEVIFSGTWAEGSMTYADMVFNMVKKVLHLPGVGSEKDAAAAAELATALFAHATPPVADAWLPAYFGEFWTRVAEVETSDLRQALLVAFATQMWYNPELFLRCTEQRGVTTQLFEVWMQKISSLRHLKHRKVALLGLVQLLRMGCAQALPANLAQGLPHLVTTLAIQSKETIRLREKAASRRPDEDTESEDGTAEPGQMDQVLRKLQMASDNDDNEDNDSEALSDEGFDGMVHAAGGKLLDLNAQRLSRLDSIDELVALRETLQQVPPQMQQQFESWVGGSLQQWMASLTAEAARSR